MIIIRETRTVRQITKETPLHTQISISLKLSYYLTKVISIISLEIALTGILLLYVTSSGCILHYYKCLVSYKFVHSSRISCGSEKYRRAHRVIPKFPPKSFVCGGL